MLKDLIVNSSILISFIFIIGEVFKDNMIDKHSSVKSKLLLGLLAGALGSVLILFSVNIYDNIVIDLRHLAVIIATIYGGFIPSIISAIVMSIVRVSLFGFNEASITGVILLFLISGSSVLIYNVNTSEKRKWIYMNIFSILTINIALYILIGQAQILIKSIIIFSFVSTLIGFIVYNLSSHIMLSNRLYRKYKVESKKDHLTGLNNVRSFDDIFNKAISDASKRDEKLSILILDVDHFKKVNDTYGHQSGDKLLNQLAKVLVDSCRGFDIVSRIGGEEFCIILPDCPNNQAIEVAERIRTSVKNYEFELLNNKKINITISIGVSTYPDTVKDFSMLIEKADNSLYKAKKMGRDRVYSNGLNNTINFYCNTKKRMVN